MQYIVEGWVVNLIRYSAYYSYLMLVVVAMIVIKFFALKFYFETYLFCLIVCGLRKNLIFEQKGNKQ